MKTSIGDYYIKLWLSKSETYEWARRWPCSQISGKSLFVEFDRNGLVDYSLDNKQPDLDSNELNAIASDFLARSNKVKGLKKALDTKKNNLYFVACGQFQRA